MTKYFGFMVCEFSGEVENLKDVETDYKPAHETAGFFAYAKWFLDEKKRDEIKAFTIQEINKLRMAKE